MLGLAKGKIDERFLVYTLRTCALGFVAPRYGSARMLKNARIVIHM